MIKWRKRGTRHRPDYSAVATLILLVVMSAAHRAGAATYTPIPGTRVQLIAPPSFVIARTFTGLQWQEAGASVVVAELPGPASEMQTGMTAEQLAKRGMALRGSDNVDAELGPAVLLEVSQNVQGVEFSKWLLIAGDASTTVMLTATSPSVVANKLGPVLRSTVLSARWTAGADVDPAAGLDIRVVETDDLRLAPTMAGTLILTNGGVSGPLGPADPLLVISRSTPPEAIADLAMFSKTGWRRPAR